MHCSCVAALRDYLGLARRPVQVHEPYQMLGWLDEDLQTALGLDVTGINPPTTIFGFPNENWQEFRLPWGQVVLVSEHFRTSTDAKGDLLIYPCGDINAPPSGRLPAGGYFFDTIIRQEPLDEDRLDPADNLEELTPISTGQLAYFTGEVQRAAAGGRGVIANFGGTGFGDIALVPAPFLRRPRGIRDIEEWYVSTATRQEYVHAVFDRQCAMALENLARLAPVIGNAIDIVFLCGTDFGTQTSSFCSPATFDALYAPYYRRINDWIHQHTTWKTFKHSCGAVEPFLSHFIACGFDALNPVQCSARGMEAAQLKEKYGAHLVFWGGGVDTQQTLPFGTPEAVRQQVLERCRIFARDGGFVFNSIHNIQARTPVANIVALFNAVREFNGQPALARA